MTNIKKINLILLKYLIYVFPLSFIIGNLAINISIVLIIILSIFPLNKEIFYFNNSKIFYLVSLFFLCLILSTFFQLYSSGYYSDWIKSLTFLRYFFLLLIIKTVIYKKILNINFFFTSSLIASIFVSVDIFIQYIFGKNILGYPPVASGGIKYFSGLFNQELIAGGFILMFSTIGIFSIFNILKTEKKKTYLFLFAILIIFFSFSLILAGNRMPVVLFLLFLTTLGLIYKKKERIYFITFALLTTLLLTTIIIKSETLSYRVLNFYTGIPKPSLVLEEINKKYPNLEKYKNTGKQFHNLKEFGSTENFTYIPYISGHIVIFITSIDIFKDKPLYGNGIKSFRNNCSNKTHLPNRVCESHPHNYVMEILNDTGIIGLFLIYSLVIYLIFSNYKDYIRNDSFKPLISNWIYLAIILSVFINFFPFKSTGSFFSTFNSAFIFMILGISIGLNELKFKNRDK